MHPIPFKQGRSLLLLPGWVWVIGPLVLALLVGACASNAKVELKSGGMTCVDDSQSCIKARSGALKALLADTERAWIRRPPPPKAYASGVRLFAFKRSKRQLNCAELASGIREAKAGPETLRSGAAGKLTPGQISRGVILSMEVERELKRERRRRCGKGRT